MHKLLSQNTVKPQAGRPLLEMAQEDQSETSKQASGSDEEKGTERKASIIEIHDSMTECEDDVRPEVMQMEDKAFVSSLHSFMKDRGTPIERIPHLGFKQINLWRIYKAVEKLGGYDSVTVRRLWKKVYDELGGSPGSTSAATCTRRHYEKLVLPFERHIRGEDDKPLPQSKPRKPYKRNLDGKVQKAERKRKRPQSDREMDSEMATQRSSEALWSDRHCSQTNRASGSLSSAVYGRLVQASTSIPWTAHIPSAAGEVISPLEKKKRVAQASLGLPQSEDKERPSVIRCSQSPSLASSSRMCSSSDGSPLPLSSSSSRSSSPSSVSSEDTPVENEDPPEPDFQSEPPQRSQAAKVCPHKESADSITDPNKEPAWKPAQKSGVGYFPHPFHAAASSFTVRPDWAPTSTSSFTKVIPKSVQLLRPAPLRPAFKLQQGRLTHDEPLPCAKKLSNVAPWHFQAEKRDKSRTMLQKMPPHPTQSLSHPPSSLPMSCVLSNYDKSGRDSRRQPPFHSVFLPNRLKLPQSQLLYRHGPGSPAHSGLMGSAVYPFPYSVPLISPHAGYTLPAMSPIYPHKL